MLTGVLQVAEEIASKSPVAVQGTKTNLVYSRDHTAQEGLDQVVSVQFLFASCFCIFNVNRN